MDRRTALKLLAGLPLFLHGKRNTPNVELLDYYTIPRGAVRTYKPIEVPGLVAHDPFYEDHNRHLEAYMRAYQRLHLSRPGRSW